MEYSSAFICEYGIEPSDSVYCPLWTPLLFLMETIFPLISSVAEGSEMI